MARPVSQFLKASGKMWEIWQVIVNVVLDLGGSDEDLARLLKDKDRVRRIGEIIVERAKTEEQLEYFVPIPDALVPEPYWQTLAKYRQLATEHGVPATTAVCYRVRAGFIFKSHASMAGPCYENFQYLQGWSFSDEPTDDCLVFWVPRIINGSTGKTKDEQVQFLADLRAKLDLPVHHMSGFGKVGLVAGLVLAHFKATQERIPLDGLWVRTDTCHAGGARLGLGGFGDAGLGCSCWSGDDDASDNLGVFALGVELGS